MSQYEVLVRLSFAIDHYQQLNPDWGISEFDEMTSGVVSIHNFEDVPEKTKEFISEMEYDAFKKGITPPFFEPPVEISEDDPLTDAEKQMLKGTE